MKKEHLILLSLGVLLVVVILGNKNTATVDVIKPGDKGNEVMGLQNAFYNMTGVRSSTPGAYDNNTLTAVQCLLKGSSALVDYEKGYVDRRFAQDLYKIQNNAKIR
jgi:hypothetical protein